MKKVIITTGGTGGHIYPALTIAKELREKEVEVVFVGTDYRMEKDIVPENNFKYIGLKIRPFRSVGALWLLLKAIIKSLKIIKKENPDAIIGFGNYITVPLLVAGILKKKDIYLQEQNVRMGMANKLFYKFSKKIFLSFEKTFNEIPLKYTDKAILTGNPIRKEFHILNKKEEREKLKFGKDEKMLLILGGSLGAKNINEVVTQNWEKILKESKIRIYWGTGNKHYKEINEKILKRKQNDVIKPYFENIGEVMAASDLMIGRAGASVISELIELQKPAILIPYDFVGQMANAKVLAKNGSAKVYNNENINQALKDAIELIKDDEQLKEMRISLSRMKKGNAKDKIIKELEIWRTR
ncbi:MAG: undecaprenyldiphospho-muramoylpentapeptide beta-N-acetylglucosaminyltransferase [Fusobacteriia bacterium 4572_132]|nr:MAG: undecaprenyldiphospho-muramoylpentapeptide beta-N-acetylglucosaminyltransferase [Fusobacteriia bacterium 4572_132]